MYFRYPNNVFHSGLRGQGLTEPYLWILHSDYIFFSQYGLFACKLALKLWMAFCNKTFMCSGFSMGTFKMFMDSSEIYINFASYKENVYFWHIWRERLIKGQAIRGGILFKVPQLMLKVKILKWMVTWRLWNTQLWKWFQKSYRG